MVLYGAQALRHSLSVRLAFAAGHQSCSLRSRTVSIVHRLPPSGSLSFTSNSSFFLSPAAETAVSLHSRAGRSVMTCAVALEPEVWLSYPPRKLLVACCPLIHFCAKGRQVCHFSKLSVADGQKRILFFTDFGNTPPLYL